MIFNFDTKIFKIFSFKNLQNQNTKKIKQKQQMNPNYSFDQMSLCWKNFSTNFTSNIGLNLGSIKIISKIKYNFS